MPISIKTYPNFADQVVLATTREDLTEVFGKYDDELEKVLSVSTIGSFSSIQLERTLT